MQKFDVPIEATTSSLEALKSYSLGMTAQREKGDAPAIPFFERAIELDPNFASGYCALANTYGNLLQPSLALENATKAYQLRDRATEREKMGISAVYFYSRGELEKEAQIYELWEADYPYDFTFHDRLGGADAGMGRYDKALIEFQEALRLEQPARLTTIENLASTFMTLNRLDDAKATFDRTFALKMDGGNLRQLIYIVGFLQGNAALMEQQIAWGAGKSGDEDALLS